MLPSYPPQNHRKRCASSENELKAFQNLISSLEEDVAARVASSVTGAKRRQTKCTEQKRKELLA
jgi:hypothetical protein